MLAHARISRGGALVYRRPGGTIAHPAAGPADELRACHRQASSERGDVVLELSGIGSKAGCLKTVRLAYPAAQRPGPEPDAIHFRGARTRCPGRTSERGKTRDACLERTFARSPSLSWQDDSLGRSKLLQVRRGAFMLTQEQDQQLVERVQRGDKRAFDLLVLKYQHKILGLIVRFVRPRKPRT